MSKTKMMKLKRYRKIIKGVLQKLKQYKIVNLVKCLVYFETKKHNLFDCTTKELEEITRLYIKYSNKFIKKIENSEKFDLSYDMSYYDCLHEKGKKSVRALLSRFYLSIYDSFEFPIILKRIITGSV